MKEAKKCGYGFFRYSVYLGQLLEGATFYFPITGLGVSEAYETAGTAIQTEVC